MGKTWLRVWLTFDVCELSAAECGRQVETSIATCGHEMGGLETIGSLGSPLVFFTEAPEDENAGDDAG